jgi:hypothetical protein
MSGSVHEVGGSDQDHRADCRHREKSDTTIYDDPEAPEYPLSDHRADETQDDIGDSAVALATHQLPSEPSGDKTDYDRS